MSCQIGSLGGATVAHPVDCAIISTSTTPSIRNNPIRWDSIEFRRERERKELSCEVWAPGGASIGGPVDCVIKTVDQRKREKEEEKEKTKQVETNKIVRRSFRSSLTAPVDSCHNNLPTQSDVTVPLAH